MSVNLSIKDVPEDLAQRLRERAARNHRSLQGEMMHILDTAVRPKPFRAMALLREIQKLGLKTESNSTDIIRKARGRR